MILKFNLTFVFAILLSIFAVRGQSIYVIDSLTHAPVRGAILQIGADSFISNINGKIKYSMVKSGAKWGKITIEQYKPKKVQLDQVRENDTVYLEPISEVLKPITIKIARKIYHFKSKKNRKWSYLVPLQKYDLAFVLTFKDKYYIGRRIDSLYIYLLNKNERLIDAIHSNLINVTFYKTDSTGNIKDVFYELPVSEKANYIKIILPHSIKIDKSSFLLVLHLQSENPNQTIVFSGLNGKKNKKLDAFFLVVKKNSPIALKNSIRKLMQEKNNTKLLKYHYFAFEIFLH